MYTDISQYVSETDYDPIAILQDAIADEFGTRELARWDSYTVRMILADASNSLGKAYENIQLIIAHNILGNI